MELGDEGINGGGLAGEAKIERNVKWNWDGISSTCTACGEGNVKRNKP